MTTQSILGPHGTPMVELGGERAWLQRIKGDIVCSFQWLDIGLEEPHPCMALFPAMRRMDTAAYVIPQRNAWAYATRDGNATPEHLGVAFKAALHMGFHPDQSTVHRIMDIIVEGIPDLVRMPSDQPASLHVARVLMGIEASAKVNGKVVKEEVL
jgi:hypothetical protein